MEVSPTAPRAASRPGPRLDRARQAAPQVFERLRNAILALELPPGSPLSRAELAAQFGVSSTPVRDALMRLEEEGLVDVFPQHATVVSRVDVGRAQQAHFLRQALELEIVRLLAASRDSSLIIRLDHAIALQQQFAKAGDFESFMAADNDFHAQLYAAAGKQELWTLVRSRSGHIDRLRRLHLPSPGKAQNILRHHKLITRAIEAGDADAAQQHLRTHLSGTLSELDKIRARHPEYLSD
ncbi:MULTISPECIES: GntR family transcriptional regulator [unclassified Bradyrhizobium]|uniref:GntR family transcriptional regulator n=1 Tax=unclassified Bradyrhizobium TaxID=2631580 RepID=UPI00247A4DFA|nr:MULTISPECIES: GntR family transcriptional regulator [unclassified Bradyrhizobium]WGR71797.1 GntR family transcriptional regulator [Bradyrhizobium sp. ISRA426]WGR76632.1 GntR family transcriptional regulator [Bradyrhizobium sp. ISRA430]WGR87037.1 GntR family transcriptional regulator [Bradyrhizobium sp. ISRA432]